MKIEVDVDLCIQFDEAIDCLPDSLDELEIAAFFNGLLDKYEVTPQQREVVACLLVPDLVGSIH